MSDAGAATPDGDADSYRAEIVEHALWRVRCRGCKKLAHFRGPLRELMKAMRTHCPEAVAMKLPRTRRSTSRA